MFVFVCVSVCVCVCMLRGWAGDYSDASGSDNVQPAPLFLSHEDVFIKDVKSASFLSYMRSS